MSRTVTALGLGWLGRDPGPGNTVEEDRELVDRADITEDVTAKCPPPGVLATTSAAHGDTDIFPLLPLLTGACRRQALP